MARRSLLLAATLLVVLSCNQHDPPHLHVDSSIDSELHQIRAIDNHAHPLKVTADGETDRDFDALPADAIQDLSIPTPFRENSPYFPEAWHALFGYKYRDVKPEHLSELQQTKRTLAKQKGDLYPSWVLNQANTDIMLANRVAMGRGLTGDRFKWVPYADMFLFPLNNSAIKAQDPEHKAFIENEEQLLKNYLGGRRLPSAFDDYLTTISHRIETWKSGGAVAVKFELAYLRDLQIGNPQKQNAERVYSIYAQSSEPTPDEYKILQDYIFRHIAREAGRLQMPVHIHTSIGAGSYFRDSNADPFALEGVFNDPALRRTKFVMLHGAWPFSKEASALILKPNVYLDVSAFMYLTYPPQAARAIRLYLEAAPEKVLYGSDASPFTENVGWEESAWIGSTTGRLALGIALTAMMQEGEITPDRAKQIAHLVMRENARQLYGF
ncbi:MAG: amidohydrolase family protein [Acidobacteriaceae bacterium]|nr:amidohydrolase family protein [Acidobacteriaceae bacterium]